MAGNNETKYKERVRDARMAYIPKMMSQKK